jgi:hypothetical protein
MQTSVTDFMGAISIVADRLLPPKDAPIETFFSETPSKDKRNGSSHILTKVNAKPIP